MPQYTFEVAFVERVYRADAITIEAETEEEAKKMLFGGEVLLSLYPDNVVDSETIVEEVYLIDIKNTIQTPKI